MRNKFLKILFCSAVIMINITFILFAAENEFLGSKTFEYFLDKKISIDIGSIYELFIKEKLPNAEIVSLNENVDMITALRSNKIDSMSCEKTAFFEFHKEDKNFKYIPESIGKISQGYILSDKICNYNEGQVLKELNEFIKESKENGYLDSIVKKWCEKKDVEYEPFVNPNPKKRLKIALCQVAPYVFFKDEKFVGLDIEFLESFAKKYNYALDYELCQFSSVLTGVEMNKYDIGVGSITVTEERKKSMNFSDVYFEDEVVLVYYEDTVNNEMFGSKKYEDFSDKKIAAQIGTTNAEIINVVFPNAKTIRLNEISDLYENIKANKADAMCIELTTYYELFKEDKNIKYIDKSLEDVPQAFIMSDDILKEGIINKQLNDYIKESKENGFLDEIIKKWAIENSEDIQYENYKNPNPSRVLKIALNIYAPYVYIKNNQYIGIDIELIESFAKKYNYGIQYENTMFNSVLTGVSIGKYDIGIGGITYTKERNQNISFSDVYFNDKSILVYYEQKDNSNSWFSVIKNSFYNSFIKENRYMLILEGILNTIIITIISVLGGIFCGFVLYLLYRKGIKVLNLLFNIYTYIINGMPFLVLLLVLYYVIFSKSDTSGIVISIIAFILTFSIFIFESLVSYIGIIDKGQIEAAYSLGFTDRKTFFKVLLPQSILRIFPSFKGEVISLLKSTSIVGYIAVTDLTRAGDLIRSRTYEAFFPIISIAIIYFGLGAILKIILSYIENKINPKNRTKEEIMAGVMKSY